MDDFEREIARSLQHRVDGMPESYDARPASIVRARRRRATKVGVFGAAVVLVAVGTVAVVAQAGGHNSGGMLSTASGDRPSVPTVRCEARLEGGSPGRPGDPSITPRVPSAGDADALERLASYAAFDDPRYVVLGPKGWACGASLSVDGRGGRIDLSPKGPYVDHASISVTNDYLWHDLVGSELACSASNDPAVLDYVRRHDRAHGLCEPDRTITRVDANVSTFRDPDGMVGASWIVLPSSDTAGDGTVSVLICRPTEGLTAADCNAVIADWIARMRAANATTIATVPTTACPIKYDITPDTPLPPPSTAPRPVTVPGAAVFASYAATTDDRYILLGPKGWTCSAEFAADGQNGFGVAPPAASGVETGGVGVVNDFLWHGGVGSGLACGVSDDPTVAAYIAANFPQAGPCPRADRTVTRVDAHTTTFVRTDGARGAGWIVLPSASDDAIGKVSVLTCQPTTGLSAADCDVIIADWIARMRATNPTTAAPSTTTTTVAAGSVPWAGCTGSHSEGVEIAPSAPRAGDPALYTGLGFYLGDIDGDPRFTVLAPRGWTCRYQDNRLPILVFDSTDGTAQNAPIVIDSDWQTACSVFEDQAVAQYVADHSLGTLPCRRAGRTVTPVNAHVARFVDADGTRGAAWVVLPSLPIETGAVSVLTCRPTAGLTAAQCDTIVADYAARADAPRSPG